MQPIKFITGKIFFLISGFLLVETLSAAEKISDKKITAAESVLPMLLGLAGILILIFVLAAILKRFSSFNLVANHIKVIESQSLGTKEKLVIVEIQNKQYLLGVTPNSINRIDMLEDPIEKKKSTVSFDSMMKQFLPLGVDKSKKTSIKSVVKSRDCHGDLLS